MGVVSRYKGTTRRNELNVNVSCAFCHQEYSTIDETIFVLKGSTIDEIRPQRKHNRPLVQTKMSRT